MAFCAGCGTELGTAAFCPKCGKPASGDAPAAGAGASPTAGIQENLAGLLCYVAWWVTGIIFFVIDKRPFVRFHAMQSIILFGAIFVLQIVGGMVVGGIIGGFIGLAFNTVLWLLGLGCWVICMLKAFQGEKFKLPVVGDLAEQYSK